MNEARQPKPNGAAALLTFAAGLSWSFTGMFTKLVGWNSFTLAGVRAIFALLVLGLFPADLIRLIRSIAVTVL